MKSSNDALGVRAATDFPAGSSVSRFTHEIKNHNGSIQLGTDLLNKYWEDLSAHLTDATSVEDPEIREDYQEILASIPILISGIRNASKLIDETIAGNFP